MKWMRGLIRTAVMTALVCFISTYVTFSLVQIYMAQLVQPFFPNVETQNMTFQQFMQHLALPASAELKAGGEKSEPQQEGVQRSDSVHTGGQSDNAEPQSGEQRQSGQSDHEVMQGEQTVRDSADSDAQSAQAGDAVAVWQSGDYMLTEQDFSKIQNNLSDSDKMEIFNMVITHVPFDEVQRLSVLLEQGVTPDGLDQAEKVVRKYFDEEEYAKFLDIIFKNGSN